MKPLLKIQDGVVEGTFDVVDVNSRSQRIVGTFISDGEGKYIFEPYHLVAGFVAIPMRLSDEEQYQIDWIKYELEGGI